MEVEEVPAITFSKGGEVRKSSFATTEDKDISSQAVYSHGGWFPTISSSLRSYFMGQEVSLDVREDVLTTSAPVEEEMGYQGPSWL